MSIVVTGATGHLGRLVVEALLERGVDPAGDRRDRPLRREAGRPGRARRAGRAARLRRRPRVRAVARRRATSCSCWSRAARSAGGSPQHTAVVELAAARRRRPASSTRAPRPPTTPRSSSRPSTPRPSRSIRASGLPFTFLRNGWYTENYLPTFDQARATGVVAGSAGDGRVASAPRADFADAAAVVLTTDGHDGAVYELSGDVAWSLRRAGRRPSPTCSAARSPTSG